MECIKYNKYNGTQKHRILWETVEKPSLSLGRWESWEESPERHYNIRIVNRENCHVMKNCSGDYELWGRASSIELWAREILKFEGM